MWPRNFKTRMCRVQSHMNNDREQFKCSFAHSLDEMLLARIMLPEDIRHNLTPLCVDYPCLDCECATRSFACRPCHRAASCTYGIKCRFAHSHEEVLRTCKLWNPPGGASRLRVFQNLRTHYVRDPGAVPSSSAPRGSAAPTLISTF